MDTSVGFVPSVPHAETMSLVTVSAVELQVMIAARILSTVAFPERFFALNEKQTRLLNRSWLSRCSRTCRMPNFLFAVSTSSEMPEMQFAGRCRVNLKP